MSTKGYKCPCCGGNLVFSSDTQKLQCPSCGEEISMDAVRQYAEILETAEEQENTYDWGETSEADQMQWEVKEDGRKVYICPSCGAELDADQTTAATTCPYCDSPVKIGRAHV